MRLGEIRPTSMTTGQLHDLTCHDINGQLLLASGVMIASDPELRPGSRQDFQAIEDKVCLPEE